MGNDMLVYFSFHLSIWNFIRSFTIKIIIPPT